MENYNIVLSKSMLLMIGQALVNMPYVQVVDLIKNLNEQIKNQEDLTLSKKSDIGQR